MDETSAEVNRERGFGPSATRRGEILIRHPGLDLTQPADMELWQKMNAAVNQIRQQLKELHPAIEIVVSLPGSRHKRPPQKGMEGTRRDDLPDDHPLQSR